MRATILVTAILAGCLLGACGRPAGGPYPAASRVPRFRVMAGEPGCVYTVIDMVRVTNPMAGNDAPTRARAMGAHALINYRYDPARREEEGTAVRFSDPSNPDCHR